MHWILLANAAHARVVQLAPLSTIATFSHEASRQRSAELGTDRSGWRMGASHAAGGAMAPRTDPHVHERERFAVELSLWLEEAAGGNRFDELTVFAPDPFYGDLQGAFGAGTRKLLRGGRAVDLSHVGPAELPARLADELDVAR